MSNNNSLPGNRRPMNGSLAAARAARPPAYARTQTDAEINPRRPNADGSNNNNSSAENQRMLLARNWSTSRIVSADNTDAQSRNSLTGDSLAASTEAMLSLGASWGAGFDQSFTGFDAVQRHSTTGGIFPPPPKPTARANSEGGGGSVAPRRYTAGISSAMHDAARLTNWDRVIEICEENPTAASYIGPGGYTALHHACSRRCPKPEVFEAVIKACPEALLIEETTKGWTPLHLACRFKCKPEAVRKLLTLFPAKGKHTVSKPDRQRRTPLYYAVRYLAPSGVVPQVLEADPSVVLGEHDGIESPLVLIWDDYAEKLEGKRALNPFIGEQSADTTPEEKRTKLENTGELYTKWKLCNLFLKAAFGFPLDEGKVLEDTADRRWRILHATAAVKCHPSLFQMACALYPSQASEMDDNDLYAGKPGQASRPQTALHLATSSNASGAIGKAVITELLRLYPEAAHTPDGIDGSYPLHRIAENKYKQHWTFDGVNPLYMMHTAAAQQVDQNGKLPLHRAAAFINREHPQAQEGGDDLATRSVICNLLQVFPEGAAARDNDGCHPLHLIAKHGGEWTEEVQAVHDRHGRAVSVRTGRGLDSSLPIHLAAANPDATGAFVKKLVELNPRGVSQEDGNGKLPLHLACELGKDWEDSGLETIHDAFVQAVSTRERNDRQWTALHMASAAIKADEVAVAAPTEEEEATTGGAGALIQKLVELHPEACRITDSQGRLPFHLACKAGKKWDEGLRALFEGNADAVAALDNEGRLPLYIVADQYARAAIIKAKEESEIMELTELNEVDDSEAGELDVLFNLVRSNPTTIPEAIPEAD